MPRKTFRLELCHFGQFCRVFRYLNVSEIGVLRQCDIFVQLKMLPTKSSQPASFTFLKMLHCLLPKVKSDSYITFHVECRDVDIFCNIFTIFELETKLVFLMYIYTLLNLSVLPFEIYMKVCTVSQRYASKFCKIECRILLQVIAVVYHKKQKNANGLFSTTSPSLRDTLINSVKLNFIVGHGCCLFVHYYLFVNFVFINFFE